MEKVDYEGFKAETDKLLSNIDHQKPESKRLMVYGEVIDILT